MHYVRAVSRLAAEPLAEEIDDIGLVVDNQNADSHTDFPKLPYFSGAADGR